MRDLWLLEDSAMAVLRERFAALASMDGKVLAEHRATFDGRVAARRQRDEGPRSLSINGSVAQIDVVGDLTPEPDFWMWLFDIPNTSYSDIREAIATAEADPSVTAVQFNVESPGGTVDGFHETVDAITSMTKPRSTRASLATSAAYGLAAAAGNVTAVGRQATFGSVGVAARFRISDYVVEVTSSEAPDKRPDPRTDEGQATIRQYLDQVHALFAEQIAAGRGTTVDVVNSTYGRGGIMLAEDALRRGMIDAIAGKPQLALVQKAPAANGGKGTKMTLEELLAAHPNLCAQLKKQGGDDAVAAERDRVNAHLVAGEASGDMKTAIKAIREGTAMTQELMTSYMMAGMNRSTVARTQQDSDDAGAAADGAAGATTDKSKMDQGLELLAQRRGKKLTGVTNV